MRWCLECHRNPEKSSGRGMRCSTWPTSARRTTRASANAWSRNTRSPTRAAHELLDMPPVSRQLRAASFELEARWKLGTGNWLLTLWTFPPFDRAWPAPKGACTGAASESWPTRRSSASTSTANFPEQASEWNDPKGRRQFLKLMSASLALAGVGACTKQPPEKIIPYVRQPEDIVPGRPLFFATAIPFGGIAQPVLVESHKGRPTKIEGNPEHPASLGATDVFTQAAILEPLRSRSRADRHAARRSPRRGASSSPPAGRARQPEGLRGAGLRFLTETDHVADARRADGHDPAGVPAGEVASVGSGRARDGARVAPVGARRDADLPLRQGRRRRLARRRLPDLRPGSRALRREDFADRAPGHRRARKT